MMMPSILDMLLRSTPAMAAECSTGGAAGGPILPFVQIEAVGGWAPGRAFIPRDEGGAFLTDARLAGASTGARNGATAQFNGSALMPPAGNGTGDNNFLRGFQDVLNAAPAAVRTSVQANTVVGQICSSTQDDSNNNRLSALTAISAAGLNGQYISSALGPQSSASGARSQSPLLQSNPPTPLRVRNISDVVGAVGLGGAMGNTSDTFKSLITAAAKNLFNRQAVSLAGRRNAEALIEQGKCAMETNEGFASSVASTVNPFDNTNADRAAVNAIYGNNNQGEAIAVYNSLRGFSGAAGIEQGGADYHGSENNRRTTDLALGQKVGRVLAMAASLNVPVLLYVYSDGSVGYSRNNQDTGGDDGTKAMYQLFHYSPDGPSTLINNGQVGNFRAASQSVDGSTIVGSVADNVVWTVVANWLSLQGRLADLGNLTSNADVLAARDELVMFS